ncbi:GNAT family N-acetyltransferase [Knoellia sp. CPCC 206453]|uniref:GNAT family N-acetyltransferase n=1 Tax=Knoellia pratensis TaxID=3404796 RepID=UPI0036242E26
MTGQSTSIRLVRTADAEALVAHLIRDREDSALWEPSRADNYYTPAGHRERIQGFLKEHSEGRMWPGVVLAGDELAGWITVSGIQRGPFLVGTVGYWIGSAHQRQGHARRALGQLLVLMGDELGLHRAEASTSHDNVASHRVLESQGFRCYGTTTSSFLIGGVWRDSLVWERVLQTERAEPGLR